MADSDKIPNIFLSYSWKDRDIADEIDNDFLVAGITFRRDIRDLKTFDNIEKYMQSISESDYVIMLISDAYLKSVNCMFEVNKLLDSNQLENKILPIILTSANGIFKSEGTKIYYQYWKDELEKAKNNLIEHNNEDFLSEKRKIESIENKIATFFLKLRHTKLQEFNAMKANNYDAIFNIIGCDKDTIFNQLLSIQKLNDMDEMEIEIDKLYGLHPKNLYVLRLKAKVAFEMGQFKRARYVCEEILKINPDDFGTHNNLGLIFKRLLIDSNKVREQYELAIKLNPSFAEAHYNLANLLSDQFSDFKEAKKYYEEALKINPGYANAHNNLAFLLHNKLSDYKGAKVHYLDALIITPNDFKLHNDLGNLLEQHLQDYPGAREHYEKALNINPDSAITHYNMVSLLCNHLIDINGAKYHYLEATSLDKSFIRKDLDDFFSIKR